MMQTHVYFLNSNGMLDLGFSSLNSYFYLERLIFLYGILIKTNSSTAVATQFLPCGMYLVHPEPTSKNYNLSITSLLSFWNYLRPVLFPISCPPTPTNLLIHRRVHVSVLCSDYHLACAVGFAYTVNSEKMGLAKCGKAEWECRRCLDRFIRNSQLYWLPNVSYIECI